MIRGILGGHYPKLVAMASASALTQASLLGTSGRIVPSRVQNVRPESSKFAINPLQLTVLWVGVDRRIKSITRATSEVEVDTSSSPSVSGNENKEIVPDTEGSITKTSFGTIGLFLGTSLLVYGFGAYFTLFPGSEWSSLMLTYGFPLAIIGMALKYAELKPVPCTTYADALALRESQATPILKQVRNDVIRFRYGDEQHLEEALKRIFRYGQSGGVQARNGPVLQSIREEVNDKGKYTLVLVFKAKALRLEDFVSRKAKFTSFFGPGVTAEIASTGENIFEVQLVADGGPQAANSS